MYSRSLYISAHLCAPSFPAAGHKLAAAKLDEIATISDWVDVITFKEENTVDAVRDYANVNYYIFNLTKMIRVFGALRYPWLPISASSRKILAYKFAKFLLKSNKYDFIYVDFTQTLEIIPYRYRESVTVRAHDVFCQLYRRQITSARGLRRWVGILEFARVRLWEPRVLRQVANIVALNEKDGNIIALMGGTSSISVFPPDPIYYVTDRSNRTIEPGLMLFWGNMSRNENVDAVEYFVTQIFPAVVATSSHARLIIAGANPTDRVLRLANDKVEVTGFVEDPSDLFRKCDIAVVPLRQGAGIKIKVLELIKSGVPTISTSVGAEGVPVCSLLEVHDEPAAFAQACVSALTKLPVVV